MTDNKDPNAECVTVMQAPITLDYKFTAPDITARFLAAIKEGRFIGSRVEEGGAVYCPPRAVCPETGLAADEIVELSDKGIINSFTIVHIPIPDNPMKPPLVDADIKLDNTDVTFLHLIGECENADVHMGMRVEAVWATPEERSFSPSSIMYFKPSNSKEVS